MTEMHDAITSSVERLGYNVSDIRILLASHAHFDHIEGHALMQRRTGAQVMAMTGDAEALESGHDTSALGAIGWEPVPVSRRLKDGDTVTLGGTTLRAIHAPGHTRGATIWMTTVEDDGRRYTVAFFTTTTPNPGVPLFDNPRHKNVIEDTRRTFRKLKAEREPDIVLVGHPQAMFAQTVERMRKGERPHPLLNGAQAWTRQLATADADFERRVAQERQGRKEQSRRAATHRPASSRLRRLTTHAGWPWRAPSARRSSDDFFIYGTAAATVFGPRFFPQISPVAATSRRLRHSASGSSRVRSAGSSWGTSATASAVSRCSSGR